MTTLLAPAPTAKTITLEIRGASYRAEAIDPGFAGVAAVRVTRLVNPDRCYDVVLQADGLVACDCPDFLARHEGKGTLCKHAKAAVSAGLLVAEVAPVESKPTPAPVTPADRKRASYFGLRIPATVVGPIAPAPIIQTSPVEADDQDDDLAPSGESWDGFEDDGRWATGPGPVDAPADLQWGERIAREVTDQALALIAIGRGEMALGLYGKLQPENRRAFDALLASIGKPADWTAWLDACRAGSPVNFREEGPRPTRSTRFNPTPAEQAAASAILNASARDFTVRKSPRVGRPTAGHPAPDPAEIPHSELCEAGAYFAPRYAV